MTQTSDEQTLKEIRAKLIGRVVIEYVPESDDFYESFEIAKNGDTLHGITVLFRHYEGREEVWLTALNRARTLGGEIFGPPGYDTTL